MDANAGIKKISLKQGDEVFVFVDHNYDSKDRSTEQDFMVQTKIKGFYCYGMYTDKLGVIPFHPGKFYGVGYAGGQRIITVTEKSNYGAAVISERLRLKLPDDLSEKVFGF